jgi:sugar phosphate isomerase/epimerase
MNHRTSAATVCLLCLVAAAVPAGPARAADDAPKGLPNPFFAMDTGLRDGKHNAPQARAATLAELGYAGSDHTGTGGIPQILKAYDARKLRLFAIYVGASIDSPEPSGALLAAIDQLKGRGTILWMPLDSRKHKRSDPAGDDDAAALLRKIADKAAGAGLKIALYPHTGSWVETVQDAVRVAAKTGRKNVGATFNLCHWLRVDGKNLEAALKQAAPRLFVVTINGADTGGRNWKQLIQTLDRGSFDVCRVLRTLKELNYTGPIGLQAYGIGGDSRANLAASMAAWKRLSARAAAAKTEFLARGDFSAFRGDVGDWKIVGEILLDPKDDRRLAWKPGKGAAVNGPRGRTRHLLTKAEHGDVEAHVEFIVPKGSNSGVYFQGRYEIQILDSWGVKEPKHGDCGGIYQRWQNGKGFEGRPPRVNASRKPGEWQSFHVLFRAPRFDASGNKTANAVFVKVVHNGVVVHENQEVTGPTRAAAFADEKPTGPIMFQGDHGPVAFRNVWIVPLK